MDKEPKKSKGFIDSNLFNHKTKRTLRIMKGEIIIIKINELLPIIVLYLEI